MPSLLPPTPAMPFKIRSPTRSLRRPANDAFPACADLSAGALLPGSHRAGGAHSVRDGDCPPAARESGLLHGGGAFNLPGLQLGLRAGFWGRKQLGIGL